MSIFRNLTRPETRSYELLSQAAIPPPGLYYPTDSGATVNTDSAMRLDAVWACVNLLTDIVAPLPWHAYRPSADGLLSRVADSRLLINPSNEVALSAVDWRGQIMRSWLLRGNAYGLVKEIGPQGEASKIQIIHPDYVSVVRLGPLGPFEYRVLGEKKELWCRAHRWRCRRSTTPARQSASACRPRRMRRSSTATRRSRRASSIPISR